LKLLISFFVLSMGQSFAHTIRQYPDAPLEIITIGHPTLRLVAKEVELDEIQDGEFQAFADDMIEKMRQAGGVGLAAPQVNVSKRMFVMKPSGLKSAEVVINPTVEYLSDKGTKQSREGCLSIPGKTFKVKRFKEIHLSYYNRHGDHLTEQAKGFRAIVIQHEYDHLNGTMISDFFTEMFDVKNDFEFVYPLM